MGEEQRIVSICPYCGCGCGFYVIVEAGKVKGIDYLNQHPVNRGSLCAKGNAVLDIVYHRERLTSPSKRGNGTRDRISWEEAIGFITERFKHIAGIYGADAIAFIFSGKCSNEENYLLVKLARLLGTNNIDNCARLCQAPTLAGLVPALGNGAMTNPFTDLINSRCIFVTGSNLAENQPIIAGIIRDAKDRGAKVIVADSRRTPTAWLADIFLQLRPGTDTALINGMLHTITAENLYDVDFISARTEGFEKLREVVACYPLEKVAIITGIAAPLIQEAARVYAKAEASAIVYCTGVMQHVTGTDNVVNLANLALVCGQVGRPGTGLLPLRGQNNVQGACDMGALPTYLPGYVLVNAESDRKRIARKWGVADLPTNPGLSVVEIFNAAAEGKIKAMYIVGQEPVASEPNSDHVRKALENLELLVVQDIFLTETAKLAHVVLPAACWLEKEGSYTNAERRVQWSYQAIKPRGEAKADWEIICHLAQRMGFNFTYFKPSDILREINTVIPSYGGITPERLMHTIGGLMWPCPSPEHPGTPILYTDAFKTSNGRGRITPVEYQPPVELTDDEYPLTLITGRVVMHYNSGSMTRRTPILRRMVGEPYVEINPSDAEQLQIEGGERVIISTRRGEMIAKASITGKILPGVVFVPYHFPGVNKLTTDSLDRKSFIPEFKLAACKINKIGD